jgi:HEAT repeat protein
VGDELGRVLRQYFEQQQQLEQEMQRQLESQRQQLLALLRAALDASEDELRAALKSAVPANRFVAAYAVGERRLPWQDDLIPLLLDNDDAVRQAARRSLVILSFLRLNPEVASAGPGRPGPPADKLTPARDFGPRPRAPVAGRKKAVEEWTEWWREQGEVVLKNGPGPSRDAESVRLAGELAKATGARHKELLKKYAETSGVAYTEAIAYAIPGLSGDARKEAREALAERLSGRKETTLMRYLRDDDTEVRRAAALALGMRDARETVAEVAKLLLDPEPSVARAAHASLRSLTGQDYLPPFNPTEEERQDAVKKYQAWRPGK